MLRLFIAAVGVNRLIKGTLAKALRVQNQGKRPLTGAALRGLMMAYAMRQRANRTISFYSSGM